MKNINPKNNLLNKRLTAMQKLGAEPHNSGLIYGKKNAAKLLGISVSELEEMIEPISYTTNPHYKSGPKIGLYDPIRLLIISKQKRCINAKNSMIKNRLSAASAVETKIKNILDWVDKLDIKFNISHEISLKELAQCAIENRNNIECYFKNGEPCKNKSEYFYVNDCEKEEFVRRWIINYLRHCASSYEIELDHIFGKVGVSKAYEKLKEKINNAAVSFLIKIESKIYL
jgi:hypothetical protein